MVETFNCFYEVITFKLKKNVVTIKIVEIHVDDI